MRYRAYLIVAAACFPALAGSIAAGCGTNVTVITDPPNQGDGGDGGYLFLTGGGGTDKPDADTPPDALPDYEDPGCPNQPPPLEQFDCDPYNQFNGDCLSGEACYIYVDYPDQPCGQEIYGSYCYPAGTGTQGDSCNGGLDCAAGYVCVITGSGTQCVELCNLSGPSGCPSGLVCEPIDVEGFGGCL